MANGDEARSGGAAGSGEAAFEIKKTHRKFQEESFHILFQKK